MLRAILLGLIVMAPFGCRGGLSGGRFIKDGLSYQVVEPQGADWRRVSFADNDLAWLSSRGHLISINATCTGHEDPSLEVLTTHLVMGFTEKEWGSRKTFELDGREALRSQLTAKLDGVPTALELVVLKKNGCVHDFSYVSPKGEEAVYQAQFDALVFGFSQELAK